MKKVLTIISWVLGVIVIAAVGFIVFLTVADYNPDAIEEIDLMNSTSKLIHKNEPIIFYTWNIGYCGLGAEEDFFMDDGTKAKPENISVVEGYLNSISDFLGSSDADFIMLQEVDIGSHRTYNINEKNIIDERLSAYSNSFAMNFDVKFVPVPLPPIGKVKSGIVTYSKYSIYDVNRYTLPGEFSWPKKVSMLDRCMLVSRLDVEETEADLVAINVHFSAYDDGSIRAQQLEFVKEFVLQEYEQGNYVIVGGDWNQTFPNVNIDDYPLYQDGTYWLPYQIQSDWIDEGWAFAHGSGTPTYRLLNEPYKEGVTQTGVIDGFLVSPNITVVESEAVDLGFESSDHNPVMVEIILN